MTKSFRLSVMMLSLSAAWPVMAQQAPSTPPTSEDESQRIVVTANKRSEKQRDVAGTVSVISGSDLERRGVRDQEDFLKLTPGVQLNRGDPNNNGITIRGLSSQASPESGGGQQKARHEVIRSHCTVGTKQRISRQDCPFFVWHGQCPTQ